MPNYPKSLEDRLWPRIEKTDNCWLWNGALDKAGYGAINSGGRRGKVLKVHRLVYQLVIGNLSEDKEIHHKCRVRNCCNPAHLEPIAPSLHRRIPHGYKSNVCAKGHEYTPENTYFHGRNRTCRICNLMYTHARRGKHNAGGKPVPAKGVAA